jgi:glycosyltransferase involved in cell wall biosynthesis
LIPAFKPTPTLLQLAADLRAQTDIPIVVVDDGGGRAYAALFNQLEKVSNVSVVRHAINLGKGAALKSGFNYLLVRFPDLQFVVTGDADGQHDISDILKVASEASQNPESFVLGARKFKGSVPMRSLIGNLASRWLYRLLLGLRVSDTQTGLRAIPRAIMERSLRIRANRYEFETEQLTIVAAQRTQIKEVGIRTIYEDNNASSHFNPLFDSARIYFVVLRYALSSIATSLVDFIAFAMIFAASGEVFSSNLIGRSVALFVQYGLLQSFVFNARKQLWRFAWFVAYVMVLGFVSASLQVQLNPYLGGSALLTKLMVETAIFVFNFLFMRDIMFARKKT